jgi:FkbM family methyltransferase
MSISRKEFLLGLGGAAVGAPLGALARKHFREEPRPMALPYSGPAPMPVAYPPPGAPVPEIPPPLGVSYAQCGEDLVVDSILQFLIVEPVLKTQNKPLNYLDVGANEPVKLSNTYHFYAKGYRGVLVEPNAALCEQLRAVRPEDTTLVAGIGITDATEADFYMMNEHGWSTFSREEADERQRVTNGKAYIQEVIKVPMRNINDVMDEHCGGAPAFLSIDTEGLDLAILRTVDFTKFRPKVICAETLIFETLDSDPEITTFLADKGYEVRGRTWVNAIYVDSEYIDFLKSRLPTRRS